MKLQFWAIGREHEKQMEAAISDYTQRISNYFPVSWKILSTPRNAALLTEADLKKKEAESVLKVLSASDVLILLDERGKVYSSIQFASLLQQKANESVKNCIFLIGGAFGVDPSISARANHILSLSSLTFPHQLVRLILSEQVYRACTILRNEKYHHI